jgi:hypothetical protein
MVNIVIALIGAIASIAVALIGSTSVASSLAADEARLVADKRVEERLREVNVVTAGYIDEKGNVVRFVGKPFTVSPPKRAESIE